MISSGPSRLRILGWYVTVAAAYELAIASFLELRSQLSILEPRVSLVFLLGAAQRIDPGRLVPIEFITGLWLLAVGLAIVRRKTKAWVKIYIASELILAAPTIFLLAISLDEGPTYAPGYYTAGLIVFCFFTAAPVLLASTILIKGDAV